MTWYRWKPQTMLNFFNRQQHRAFEIRENSLYRNSNGTFSYRVIPPGTGTWYIHDDEGHVYWNDRLTVSEKDNTIMASGDKYSYNVNELVAKYVSGYQPVVLSENNIFMPYPESDVIQNKYLSMPAQPYDFTWDVEK